MRNFWLNIPRSVSAVRALELSKEAKHRLRMMQWYDEHGRNAALTCRHFGISGDTFQVDTAHVSLFSGFSFKHFTACDVFTRWQVLEAHGRATAHAAAGFLDTILERLPLPKPNGHGERAQRTHKEEFYSRLTSATTLTQVNKLLRKWEEIHNTYRPHQALGQIPPLAFYRKCA